ncbi:MAG: VOC family protein [Chloroflexota bacterium]
MGLYPASGEGAEGIAEWYNKTFGWPISRAGRTGYFANEGHCGWIESMSGPVGESCHIGVKVSDFEAAVEDLKARGFELEEPKIAPTSKLVYLKQRDPGGNLVHIVWRA